MFQKWEIMPNMKNGRGGHGCDHIKAANTDYLVVLGGGTSTGQYSDISFYNIEQQTWNPTTIALPGGLAAIQGVIALQLDSQKCNAMILSHYPLNRLYMCEGNYNWTWIDTTGKTKDLTRFIPVGTNEILPCGVE
jgi:hypothetical protein